VFLNSPATIVTNDARLEERLLRFTLSDMYAPVTHTLVAPVAEPRAVDGAGARVASSQELQTAETGWLYDAELQAVILKHSLRGTNVTCELQW